MLICCMHPTVMHEDSKLVSGDFPGMCKKYLHDNVVPHTCPILYHTGPAGNQSPRHVVEKNIFSEAERLGTVLGKEVELALGRIEFSRDIALSVDRAEVDLPLNRFLSVSEAEEFEKAAQERLDGLRRNNAPRGETRTAECDWFGAERRLALARLAESGALQRAVQRSLPAEIQIFHIGPWHLIGWPGEIFVEFDLAIKEQCDNTYVTAYTNGSTEGYLVTAEAVEEGGYEAAGGIFKSPDSAELLLQCTCDLLGRKP